MNSQATPPKTIYVYVLTDPRYPDDVRYVGVTTNPKRRLARHIQDSKNKKHHRANWINSLLRDGLKPIMTEIDETNSEEWQQCEIGWIAHYRGLECDLVNGADGGWGVMNPSDDTRKKMSKPKSDDTRKRMSESNTKKKPIIQYTIDGVFIRQWDSITQVSRELSFDKRNIAYCCQGMSKRAYNFIWRYASDPLTTDTE